MSDVGVRGFEQGSEWGRVMGFEGVTGIGFSSGFLPFVSLAQALSLRGGLPCLTLAHLWAFQCLTVTCLQFFHMTQPTKGLPTRLEDPEASLPGFSGP